MSNANFKIKNGLTIGVTNGIAPIVTDSTTLVINLNADQLDGQEGSFYLDPANLSAPVPLTLGGTGATSANDGLNALLPSQTGNGGKVLQSDGVNTSWSTPAGGVTITDDTTTNADYYVTVATVTSGSLSALKIASTKMYFNPSTGTLSATNFFSLSDIQFKTDIQPIDNALSIVNSLNGVGFKWKQTGEHTYGIIAQELEKIIPDIVHTSQVDGAKRVEYSALIGFLIEAIKELSDKVRILENK